MAASPAFLPAFLRGTATATAVGIGFALGIALAGLGGQDDTGESFVAALVTIFGLGLVTLGAPITGAIAGAIAGAHSNHRGMAALAGLAAGAVGQFLAVVLVFATAAFSLPSDGSGFGSSESSLDWSQFAQTLLFLAPAAASGGLVALVAAWPRGGAPIPTSQSAPAASTPAPSAMRKSACPRCKTVVSYAAGTKPVCPSCGFGS